MPSRSPMTGAINPAAMPTRLSAVNLPNMLVTMVAGRATRMTKRERNEASFSPIHFSCVSSMPTAIMAKMESTICNASRMDSIMMPPFPYMIASYAEMGAVSMKSGCFG